MTDKSKSLEKKLRETQAKWICAMTKGMGKSVSADLIDITQNRNPDISMYEIVGLASGVYFHSFHETLKNFVHNASFKEDQKVFLVAPCGIAKGHPNQQKLKKAADFIKNITKG